MATNYEINYNDERFTKVETEKNAALSDIEKVYSGMADSSDAYYQKQIEASKDWADKQSELQQAQTDFAIEKIEQEKAQAQKDYIKEQSGAYVDWQKQSNAYGANAEQMAASGLKNTGYSESSQVSMYNTYQNRVATARESYNQAVLNYNNAITEARLQNNSILAEIAIEALQKQLELSLQGFQHKNSLIIEQSNKKLEVENNYYNRYLDVLDQINTENSLAEQIRQFNAKLEEEQRQFKVLHETDTTTTPKYGPYSSSGKSTASSKKSSSSETAESTKAGNVTGTNTTASSKTSSVSGTKSNKTTAQSVAKTEQSILDLGYGPISGQTLYNLVTAGAVKETKDKDGTTVFIPTTNNVPTAGSILANLVKDEEDKGSTTISAPSILTGSPRANKTTSIR